MESAQFVGSACGKHSSYTFFKAFKFRIKDRYKVLSLGQFFFVRISNEHPLCVAELQLLWEDQQSQLKLSSTKLYFLPEDIPDGRSPDHGQDELLAVSEKIVLRLEDLVSWINWDAPWSNGRLAREVDSSNPTEDGSQNFELNNKSLDISDIKKEKEILGDFDGSQCSVKIISYPQYYRYRALEKQLEKADPSAWNDKPVIKALGGITVAKDKKVYIMFCRDVFDHPKLFENEKCCNYLAPSLKGRPRKKKKNNKRSASPGSESNDSMESKSSVTLRARKSHVNGVKLPKLNLDCATTNEKEFYADLFSFMKKRNTPIGRIPSLGFKSIDLYYFYKRVTQLGGYDRVSQKRLWKQMFEEVAGSQSSTSAATTTRKHYERLLLPYECSMKKSNVKRAHHTRVHSKTREGKAKENNKVESDSDGDGTKNGSTSGQDSEEQETGGENTPPPPPPPLPPPLPPPPPPQVVEPEPEINLPSGNENKRTRTDSPEEHPANKRAKEDLQIEKEKKWEEIRKKNAMSRVRTTSGSSLAQTYKKSTVANAMQKRLESLKVEPGSENPIGMQKPKEERMKLSASSTARPSVIQHASLPIDNLICDINSRTRHSNGGPSLLSFSRLPNHSPRVSPSLNSHVRKSSSPSSKPSIAIEIMAPDAHQSSIFKSSIDIIKKSVSMYKSSDQTSLITNKKAAHEASIPASQWHQQIQGKELLDLSKKHMSASPITHPRVEIPRDNIHMNMPIVNPPPIEKKPSQSSPLMSLTSMSAKLEKYRTSKTVKVPPMINTSSISKSTSNVSNRSKPDVPRPVFSVNPQVLDKQPSNSSKPNSVVHPVQSSAVSNNNPSLVDPASANGHYSLPHYATSFPCIMPPNLTFPSGQFAPPYFPPAMFGLPYPGMLLSDNVTHPYRELMHRGLLPGQCQTSMYPGFPSLDSVSVQMYNASQHLLRPNNFPSSKSANKP